MTTIAPHLWFDTQARAAAEFYVSVFGLDSRVTGVTPIEGTPSGDAEMVTFTLLGQDFLAISAGPIFTFNPAVSFMVNFDPARTADARQRLDAAWEKLSQGGTPLMPLDRYPFSERYGWIQDKYGLSWQLILTNPAGQPRPWIIPSLLFVGEHCGQAEEAGAFYRSVFKDAEPGMLVRYGKNQPPDREGTVMFSDFRLENLWLAAMDSAHPHAFTFNEAVSLVVSCDTQQQIDVFWEALSAHPEAEQCGWLKDKFGVSWQVVPGAMGRLMGGTREQRNRVTQAFLKMKKFDIAALERAYRGD
jgi:predicted 3-demethylubiquinone-9 3-methyltransferase (glyoxalase superfamily)